MKNLSILFSLIFFSVGIMISCSSTDADADLVGTWSSCAVSGSGLSLAYKKTKTVYVQSTATTGTTTLTEDLYASNDTTCAGTVTSNSFTITGTYTIGSDITESNNIAGVKQIDYVVTASSVTTVAVSATIYDIYKVDGTTLKNGTNNNGCVTSPCQDSSRRSSQLETTGKTKQ